MRSPNDRPPAHHPPTWAAARPGDRRGLSRRTRRARIDRIDEPPQVVDARVGYRRIEAGKLGSARNPEHRTDRRRGRVQRIVDDTHLRRGRPGLQRNRQRITLDRVHRQRQLERLDQACTVRAGGDDKDIAVDAPFAVITATISRLAPVRQPLTPYAVVQGDATCRQTSRELRAELARVPGLVTGKKETANDVALDRCKCGLERRVPARSSDSNASPCAVASSFDRSAASSMRALRNSLIVPRVPAW